MRKHFFINRINLLSLLIFAVLTVISLVVLKENLALGCGFLVISLFPLGCFVLFPQFFVMDEHGIRIYYMFFLKEDIPWKSVSFTEINYGRGRRALPYIFDTFTIHGTNRRRSLFFMRSEISRTRRARRLIEGYTGEKIEGFFVDEIKDDVSGLVGKWRAKKSKKYSIEKIRELERKTRAEIRQVISEYASTEIECSVSYIYRTAEGETASRPRVDYVYWVKIIEKNTLGAAVCVPLVSVRVKKDRYYGKHLSKATASLTKKLRAFTKSGTALS